MPLENRLKIAIIIKITTIKMENIGSILWFQSKNTGRTIIEMTIGKDAIKLKR